MIPTLIVTVLAVLFVVFFRQGSRNEPYNPGNVTPAISKALPLIKHYESFKPEPYYCSSNKRTIGYGHVMQPGDPERVTEPEALAWLKEELQYDYLVRTTGALQGRGINPAELSAGQMAALISAVYNNGAAIIVRGTWVTHYLSGKMEAARDWFYKWNKAGDPLVITLGLVRRRFSEWQLFTTGSWNKYPPGYKNYYYSHGGA